MGEPGGRNSSIHEAEQQNQVRSGCWKQPRCLERFPGQRPPAGTSVQRAGLGWLTGRGARQEGWCPAVDALGTQSISAADAGRDLQMPRGKSKSLAEQLPQQQGELKPASSFLQPEQLLHSAEKEGAKVSRCLFDKYIFDTFKWRGSLYAQLNTLSEAIQPVWLPALPTPLPLLASARHHAARTPVGGCMGSGKRQTGTLTFSYKMGRA